MSARGFTLIELLVVIAVLAIAVAAVPVVMSGGFSGISLKATARAVADGLRYSRSQAIAHNDEVAFIIDAEAGRYAVVPGDHSGTLGGVSEVRVFPEAAAGTIRFFPDGSSTGGRITLAKDRQQYHVSVDWLTGRISVAR